MVSANLTQLFGTFINALHILHNNGVLDAYGHLSVRNPNNTTTFFMSRNVAPALVSSLDDIVEYHISDASPVEPNAPNGFIERYIHSEIYKRFSQISTVVHSHSPAVIPYSINDVPLKPLIHMAGFLGERVPVFDISKHYRGNDTQDLLVRSVGLGAALAAEFSAGGRETNNSLPDYDVALMQSHGFTTCATGIENVVVQAYYTQVNAQVQSEALTSEHAYLGPEANSGDKLTYLTQQQASDAWASNMGTVQRPWDLWVREVKYHKAQTRRILRGQIRDITEMSLRKQADGSDGEPEAGSPSSTSSALKIEANQASVGVAGDDKEAGMSTLERITTSFGARPECFKNTLQEVAFVLQATVATASSAFLAGTALIITVPVSLDLNMTQGQISLVAGAFQLALGQLADLLGRKVMFITGMAGFSLFSLLVAFAQNPFWMLIVCGVLGIPAAMVVPPAIGILGAAYATPSKRKNAAFSSFSAGNPLGFVFGTILCGIATQLFNWRAAFILLSIIWAVFTVFAFWAVPNVETFERAPLRQRLGTLKQFDYLGTILTIFGTGMFTAGLTLGPQDGWSRAHVIALIVVGILLLVVFVFWEKVFPTPLMPLYIWKDRNFSLIIIVVVLGNMSFQATGFWVAFFMQQVQRLSTLNVAVRLLPMAVAGLLWNVLAGRILHKVNNTLIMIFGAVSYLAAALLFSFMRADSNYWAFIFPALVLNVAGADLQFNVANMYVLQSLPSHQQSLAGGIFNVFIRLSNTAVLGISTAVFSSIQSNPTSLEDPILKYTRTFQTTVALAAAGVLISPFIKLGTQGNAPKVEVREEEKLKGSTDAVDNGRDSSVDPTGELGDNKKLHDYMYIGCRQTPPYAVQRGGTYCRCNEAQECTRGCCR
ncbi:major facilitator superfamily domain-containing protein [Xylaria longipes]|nr:major facilitator superfamily domain-containing protein [Xylaria longipes]